MTEETAPTEGAEKENDVQQDTPEEQLAAARAEIIALAQERDAERERALRLAAEVENTRRRLERDKADAVQYAAAAFARDMLSVADNLGRALDAIPADNESFKAIRVGVEMTNRELITIFERNGIKRIPATGLPLDPNHHQAMVEVESDAEPGTVVDEMQAGYTLKDRLLRPALVTVAKAPARTDTTAEG